MAFYFKIKETKISSSSKPDISSGSAAATGTFEAANDNRLVGTMTMNNGNSGFDKISNSYHQQKTIKSLLSAFSKEPNVFRNIKTTTSLMSTGGGTIKSMLASSSTNSQCLQSFIDNSNNNNSNGLVMTSGMMNEDKRYECSNCNRCYNDAEKLKRHVNNTHKKEKKFECNMCEKK